jgi:hypothetical protein
VRFPDVAGKAATPWFVAAIDAPALRVAVSLYGQGAVALVDLAKASVDRTVVLRDQVVLDAPYHLPVPTDIDGDGVPETEVSRFVPKNPQPVAVIGDGLFVAFTSFVSPRVGSMPPIFLPGVLARWSLADLDAAPKLLVLPNFDPQELRVTAEGQLLVACSGVLDFQSDGTWRTDTPGAVLRVDPLAMHVVDQWDLADFAPVTAVIAHGSLWAGSASKGAVIRIGLADPSGDRQSFALSTDATDSIFRLLELDGGLLAAASYNNDRLYLIDTARRMVSPPPFYEALAIGPGRPIFDGVQVLARRPGRAGVDFSGPDLFALAGQGSRVRPIEIQKILGP